MQRPASLLRQHPVNFIQQFVQIDQHFATVRCRRTTRLKVFKLRDTLAKSFDKSLGRDLNIELPHSLDFRASLALKVWTLVIAVSIGLKNSLAKSE